MIVRIISITDGEETNSSHCPLYSNSILQGRIQCSSPINTKIPSNVYR